MSNPDDKDENGLSRAVLEPPPPYVEAPGSSDMIAIPLGDEPPPEYSVAAKLPSYEESERSTTGKPVVHNLNEPALNQTSGSLASSSRRLPSRTRGLPRFTLLAAFPHHDPEDPIGRELDELEGDHALLGNDLVFFTAFLTSFLFNWIGFLLLMCFCHTVAARYGALAGFGLSLTKWTMIVKRSTEFAKSDNSWLWWLIMAFGLLICVRAIIQYLQIKRSWSSLSSHARERLLFFY
ncbi:hypothetical protein TCAL_06065 [Tigriopus californicus]|uniref:Uncharacterized protein n=1 Tax=Tigriopus californicus TaxID=6832 RepID=A0A553PQ66_TIGCA|nr:NEDD4 family-interacting protein 1-like [Tigriopus californicus]TRY79801.1 hypothetical protein TCAL_06065 [Tigriopus californicus]